MNKLVAVALKEFQDGVRNRWIVAIGLIFVLLALGIAYFGSAASGAIGFSSLQSTVVSLASLAVILVPLIALMLAHGAFVGEYEQGTMLLLLTYPLSHGQLLWGKFFGQGGILAVSTLVGFGVPALVLILVSGEQPELVFDIFGWFILASILLGWVFIALAYLISVFVSEKSKAAGLSLVLWFVFVLVFDLGLLALLVAQGGDLSPRVLATLLFFNPTDVFRLIVYAAVEASEYSGVLQLASLSPPGMGRLLAAMVIWVLIPLGLTGFIFKRRES